MTVGKELKTKELISELERIRSLFAENHMIKDCFAIDDAIQLIKRDVLFALAERDERDEPKVPEFITKLLADGWRFNSIDAMVGCEHPNGGKQSVFNFYKGFHLVSIEQMEQFAKYLVDFLNSKTP
jgi:hypothetical protein